MGVAAWSAVLAVMTLALCGEAEAPPHEGHITGDGWGCVDVNGRAMCAYVPPRP
jgi:hypothetical protein